MALDATVKGSSSNSYLTRAEANTYFAERLHASTWDGATDAQKDAALIQATSLLDVSFDWVGAIRTVEQALRWPRSGAFDQDDREYDYDIVPTPIKNAVCEVAIALIANDVFKAPDLEGTALRSGSAGTSNFTYDATNRHTLIPKHVRMTINHIGEFNVMASPRGGVVRVRR